jgi:Hypoxia induced protein conserved region
MSKTKDDLPISITGNEARAGLHEHRAHYVLAFGLAGGIIAFVAVGLYFGYDKLTQTISQMSLPSNPTTLVSYAILIAFAVIGAVLLHGLWSMVSGGSLNTSQRVMRWRVVLQFIALCLVVAALYLFGKH